MKFRSVLLAFLAIAAILRGPDTSGANRHEPDARQRLSMHAERSSVQDLKLSGDIPGQTAASDGFVTYDELSRLPQVTFTVTDDSNFPGKEKLTGVYLDELLKALGYSNTRQIIAAAGSDDYEAHYTEEYRAAHHPLLVLRINGREPDAWPANGGDALGPYVISHAKFTPAFHILSHVDEAQIPYGVVELKFRNEDEILKALRPAGKHGQESPEMRGARIAFQNCLRCHNLNAFGGHKAGIT
jgi:hypothetical protein